MVFPFVRASVRPETLLTRYLAEYLHIFTKIMSTMRYGTEMNASRFRVKSSKVKVTME